MGTIYLSPDFAAGNSTSAAKRIFEVGGSGFDPNGAVTQPLLPEKYRVVSSTPYAAGRLIVMQGTPPAVISTVTSFSSYTSTVLCAFEGADFTTASSVSYYASPSVLTSAYKPATATGTATWFLLLSTIIPPNSNNDYYNSAPLFHQIVGNVGAVGSGADLEIANVNVTTGQLLRIYNLRFSIPTTFTF